MIIVEDTGSSMFDKDLFGQGRTVCLFGHVAIED